MGLWEGTLISAVVIIKWLRWTSIIAYWSILTYWVATFYNHFFATNFQWPLFSDCFLVTTFRVTTILVWINLVWKHLKGRCEGTFLSVCDWLCTRVYAKSVGVRHILGSSGPKGHIEPSTYKLQLSGMVLTSWAGDIITIVCLCKRNSPCGCTLFAIVWRTCNFPPDQLHNEKL